MISVGIVIPAFSTAVLHSNLAVISHGASTYVRANESIRSVLPQMELDIQASSDSLFENQGDFYDPYE